MLCNTDINLGHWSVKKSGIFITIIKNWVCVHMLGCVHLLKSGNYHICRYCCNYSMSKSDRLTSTVHLTEVRKPPHVSKSDCIWHTCQHKLSRTVPVGSWVIFHVCVLRMGYILVCTQQLNYSYSVEKSGFVTRCRRCTSPSVLSTIYKL